jgi:very-short-patch-repair endonuclease
MIAQPFPPSSLRKDMTNAERTLWSLLRQRPEGLKFRRQHPIGAYVADFACPEIGLIIELDGGQHNLPVHQLRDQRRTEWLESKAGMSCGSGTRRSLKHPTCWAIRSCKSRAL